MTSETKKLLVMAGGAAALVVAVAVVGLSGKARGRAPLEPIPEPPRLSLASGDGSTLQVAAATPQGPAGGEVRPSITFDRPVVPLATPEELAKLPAPASILPAVPGTWRWLGSTTVEFVPAQPLPLATAFQVTVPAGLTAVDGSRLAAPATFSFSTRAPEVRHLEPRDGWKWVARRQTFSLTFNQPVEGLAAGVELWANDQKVPVTVGAGARVVEEEYASANAAARRWIEERRATDLRTRYDVTPSADLPVGAAVRLVVQESVHGAAGPLPVSGTRWWNFRVHGPMAVTGLDACGPGQEDRRRCPFGPLVLRTTNPADPEKVVAELKQRLTLQPPVEIDWDEVAVREPSSWDERSTPALLIPGKFRPATTYRITLAGGLPDQFGQGAPAWQGTFATTDLTPTFELLAESQSPVQLVEADGDGAIPLRTANLDELDLRFWRLTPASAAALIVSGRDKLPAEPPQAIPFRTGAARNAVKVQPVPIRDYLGGARSGLFFLEAFSRRTEPPQQTRVLGQLTDLAVHARLGVTGGAVWVTRVSDGKPVEGAEVVLHDAAGNPAWRGTTDAAGVVTAAGLGAFAGVQGSWWDGEHGRRVVSASKGGDTGLAVATWEGGLWPGAFGLDADTSGGAPVELGLLTAERGIYRPGETIHLKGFLRYRAMGEIRTPRAGTEVALTVTNARDGKVLEKTVTLSRFGTFDAEVVAPAESPLGTWSASALATVNGAKLRLAHTFRVEAYRAPQFRVDVTAPATHLAGGDPVQAQVLARYLFGAALSEANVRWTVARQTLDFRPPRHDGWEFGVRSWSWDDGEPEPSGDVVATGTGKTDALGGLAIAGVKAEASADRTWEYAVEAEVEDLSRQRVAERVQLVVHPASLYAGVKRPNGFATAGKPLELELVAVTPAGERREATVAVEVRRREWKWIKKKGVGGHWITEAEPVEEKVGACTARAGAAAGTCAVTPPKPGFHVVEASLTDEKGRRQVTRTGVYVVGDGWVSWQRDETDRIDLVPDKATYQVGETARLLVKSPWPEAEALLSVEREGVLSARKVTLSGAAAVLEVPIGEEAVPNVYVGLVATRGRVAGQAPAADEDPGRPAVKTGYVQLKVERAGKRLAVQVKADRAEYRPRDTVKLDLEVKDARGRGTPAELTVWAVDEGVLRLTGYQLPDLMDAIHPPRGLAVRPGEALLGLVLRKAYSEKGASPGGGGGGPEGAAMRSLFKTTPLFAPTVQADAAGRAHVEFQLPDNLTTFRVLAVALTEGDLTGGAQTSVTVARPLLALPALPRAARVGDRFEAGVVIHAPGAKVDAVEVTAEAQGLKLDGPAVQKVSLAGKPREVRFRFAAERAGTATLRFRVQGGGEEDGVEQKLPVTLPILPVATALQGETAGTAREQLVLPKDVRADTGGLEVTLSSTALGGFAEGMSQLVDYPYGCLEQLSSRLVPFVALRELSAQGMAGKADWLLPAPQPGLPGQVAGDTPDDVIRKTVQAIESRQHPDGSYRYWPGATCPDPWSSAYAVWALGRAEKAGMPVDRAALRRGQGWLAETVLAARPIPCFGRERVPSDAERVFALFALARTGDPRASYHAELTARRSTLPLFSRAMLADALARGGAREKAKPVLAEVLDAAKVTGAEVHLEEAPESVWVVPWGSDARSTAMALLALLDVQPDHPYAGRMVTWLVRARRADGRFRTTQEAAYTLTALAELVRVKEAQAPDFTGRVSLGGAPLGAEAFKGRSLEVKKVRVAMADLLQGRQAGAPLPLDLTRDGAAGTLHYGVLLRAAPATPPTAAEERGLFVQRWLEPWQGGGQVRTVAAGEVLRLRVRLSTPQRRSFVALEVPLPSGLEAIDTSLASSARLPAADGGEADRGWFWSPFQHVELRDDRVILFADDLPAGLHTYALPVRATTPGQFLLSPARAEEMYAPEVYGRSEGGTFTVSVPGPAETASR